ncbi:MAG: glycosyltransferase family 39 protein [Planctomycetota bacterium]
MAESSRGPWWHAAAIIALCAALFLPRLGERGLAQTEGHRVMPAWAMLEVDGAGSASGVLVPEMFDRPYLRKPPGMPWAVAASGWVFGASEWSARLVSVLATTAAALASWWFAARWFGGRWALAAGLGYALMPVWWPSARTAEIEALMLAGTTLAVLGVLDAAIVRRGFACGVALAAGLTVAVLSKGPAALPAIGAALAVAVVLGRGSRGALWIGLAAALLVIGGLTWRITIAAAGAGPELVTQGSGEFLWRDVVGVLALPAVVLASGMPASLALVFAWGPDAKRERFGEQDDGVVRAARLVTWTVCASVGVYALVGVDNPRYAWPALVAVPALLPYVWRGVFADDGFLPKRVAIGRLMLLGSRWSWAAMLGAAGLGYAVWGEARFSAESGRAAGLEVPAMIDAADRGLALLADGMIEARPEVVFHAARASGVRAAWTKLDEQLIARAPVFVLLRDDATGGEWDVLRERFATELVFVELGRVRAHKFEGVLARVTRVAAADSGTMEGSPEHAPGE